MLGVYACYETLRATQAKGLLSPYLCEQATIYDCTLSIINSYKLLLLLAVWLAVETLQACVRGQLLTTLNNQHDLWAH